MPDQHGVRLGGTMRLGAYPCAVKEGSRLYGIYGRTELSERHRHRFEFNNAYREAFEDAGMKISGTSPDGRLVEVVEIPDRKFYIGCSFIPSSNRARMRRTRCSASSCASRRILRTAETGVSRSDISYEGFRQGALPDRRESGAVFRRRTYVFDNVLYDQGRRQRRIDKSV